MYKGILTCHLTFFLPHVLPCAVMCCRCMMHGFNLVLGSILAYPWAQELLVQAQRVVTYFRASHRPLELVRQAAAQFQISKGLHSANTTRFVEIIMFFIMIIVLSTHANLHDECECMLGKTCY